MGTATACTVWATPEDVCAPCDGYDFDQDLLERSLQVATDVLYVLSGRQFPGICTETLRPCADRTHRYRTTDPGLSSPYTGPVWASGFGARWWTGCSHRDVDRCGCSRLHALSLGVSPITEVTEVRVDGVVLDESAYRVDNDRELIRLDGDAWPSCQDLTLPDDEGFAVTVSYGVDPPTAGVQAAAALGCEIALSCDPETAGDCSLPKRVTSITRQGLQMVVLDPFEFLEEGKTGVYAADLFLKAYNPHKLQRRPSVMSPDIRPRARRVGT